jgi:mRNA interferase RelE/StbE
MTRPSCKTREAAHRMRVVFSPSARRVLESLNQPIRGNIIGGIRDIPQGDIVPLKGMSGSYRLRVGAWRILFSYAGDGSIWIEKISPRGNAYKGVT